MTMRWLVLLLLISPAFPPVAAGDDDAPFEAEGLVQLVPGAHIADFNVRYGTTVIESYPPQNIHRLALPATLSEADFEAVVMNDLDVLHADRVFRVLDANPEGSTRSFFFLDVTGRFSTQPTWDQIGLPHASAHPGGSGAGVTVAVIDTGIAAHPFLGDSVAPGGANFVEWTSDPIDVADALDNNQNGVADEFAGHGTMIAGLIRAVAPQASLLPIRVMDDEGRCDTFKLVAGIHHAVEHGADVLNLSLGTTDPSDLLRAALQRAAAENVLIVAAAGNDDRDVPRRYPAGFVGTGLFAVTACDELDQRADFSNWGSHIVLTAPGVDITSTALNGQFGRGSGTSLSAPLVAGALARLRSARPGAASGELRALLEAATVPLDDLNPSYVGQLGAGRLDVAAAVAAALGLGDLNCDGAVTVTDISPFVLALTNPAAYALEFPDCDAQRADFTGEGALTVSDIAYLVSAITTP